MMNVLKRSAGQLLRIFLVAASSVCAVAAWAQAPWKPDQALEIVVTCKPGCGPDVAARVMQRIMQNQRLVEVPVNVINKAGGGGAVAYSYLHQRPGDAHAVVLAGITTVINPILGRGIGYRELTPFALVAVEYVGIAVRPDSPMRTATDLIAAVKQDPASVSFGIANSLGNANHQAIALALKSQGMSPRLAKTVVFQSGANAATAMLGGHVDVVPASLGSWVTPRKTGQVRVIGVSAPKRLEGEFADVATLREQGIESVVSVPRTITGSPGLSKAQVDFWSALLAKTFATPEWKQELDARVQSGEFVTGAEFMRYLDDMDAQLRVLLPEIGMTKKKKSPK
jgi:putative tricarboxylic transport membrane protein